MLLFYTKEINASQVVLADEEAKHCTKVLRKKAGDEIFATDGKGKLCKAIIQTASFQRVIAAILEVVEKPHPKYQYTSIAMALPKNLARMEWFCEKATEIGVHQIFPITTSRTERTQEKEERFKKMIIAAAKQSGKAYFPEIFPVTDFSTFLKSNAGRFSNNKFIAWCECPINIHLKNKYQAQQPGIVLIGPEGDFSQDEVQEAISYGFEPISLGENRLRIETAGIVVCNIVNLLHEV